VLSVSAFPTNPVIDNFNRPSGILGLNWNYSNTSRVRIQHYPASNSDGVVQVRDSNSVDWAFWRSAQFGANQEAYFTFSKVSTVGTTQGLLLKLIGNNPNATNNSSWIQVAYNAVSHTVSVMTKNAGQNVNNAVTQVSFPATFAANDQLGARTWADGLVKVYKNGAEIGSVNVTATSNPWPAALAAGGGYLGVRFIGTTNTDDARFDNFGGGNVLSLYDTNLYEVGPGYPYSVIQDALDAAAASPGDDLVVVYPGTPDLTNPRANPRGAYYENLIITSPVMLQGVGPGGVISATNTTVPGSIIDGSAFGGDTALADAWRARIAGLTWIGNQTISEGEVIYLLAQSDTQYTSGFKTTIDGLDLRGGDQQGQANTLTQGGAIFANTYIRNLQVTNNVVESNNSSYGTLRFGTPDLLPDPSNHNENLRIANNRIIANAGTNLAGGIALFAGTDNYEVANNDICGNFSAEYGGGISVYGYSPNGKIHDNRIYFNQSYDEGGGIIIAGQLPADPAILSPGSGPVDIFNNLIQGNLANDDGGGIRFLMAGNFPMNVYNNIIVNNVSTHEGGGISLNDAPNVRIYNNTIVKNITTATALTSNGFPAPAGVSTSANSDLLQATLPGGSPIFSQPLLFNNIFWDNRAGTRGLTTVTGIGAGGPGDIFEWNVGVADGFGTLNPDASDFVGDPLFVATIDIPLSFATWRTNPNFVGAIMVTADLPPNLLSDYHLQSGSPAIDFGIASRSGVSAPSFDIDGEARPGGNGIDAGADEAILALALRLIRLLRP
jgi:hypothetical protein